MQTDYSSLALTAQASKAFRKFRRKDTATLTRAEYNELRHYRLVGLTAGGVIAPENMPGESGLVGLTRQGKEYRAHLQAQTRKVTIEWIRYGITTVIAVAALLLHFIWR